MNIPATGPNLQKARFFKEVAQAFEFLSIFHELSSEEQTALNQSLTLILARKKKE